MQDLFTSRKFQREVIVDSRALFDTTTTLHDNRQYRLRKTVARIRNVFETGELDVLRWVRGTHNYANALTKLNFRIFCRLNY